MSYPPKSKWRMSHKYYVRTRSGCVVLELWYAFSLTLYECCAFRVVCAYVFYSQITVLLTFWLQGLCSFIWIYVIYKRMSIWHTEHNIQNIFGNATSVCLKALYCHLVASHTYFTCLPFPVTSPYPYHHYNIPCTTHPNENFDRKCKSLVQE